MIVYRDKKFMRRDNFPDTDWVGDADWVLDDNDINDIIIEEKIIGLYPNFDFVLDENGKIADVIETEHEAVPVPPTNAELAAAIAELAGVIMNG